MPSSYLNSAGKLLYESADGKYINGTAGADKWVGTSANEFYAGGGGADILAGGLGDDQYTYTGNETLTEAANAGIDTEVSYTTFAKLPANFENMVTIAWASATTRTTSSRAAPVRRC